ncbi:MAG: hypothetical protein WBC85_15570 [Planktotalea sp.]
MYTETTTRMSRADYEARARFERSAAFHKGLASMLRVFHPRAKAQKLKRSGCDL